MDELQHPHKILPGTINKAMILVILAFLGMNVALCLILESDGMSSTNAVEAVGTHPHLISVTGHISQNSIPHFGLSKENLRFVRTFDFLDGGRHVVPRSLGRAPTCCSSIASTSW